MMPRIDGLEVARRLKADVMSSRIPILMLTSLSGVDDRVKGLEAGADDYMAKPFDLRELGARVQGAHPRGPRERDRNPTTNLPGSRRSTRRSRRVSSGKADCAVLYLDIDHFDAYADAIGIRKADDIIAELGELVLERARAYGGAEAFVGHVGGDDFIVVVAPDEAEELAQRSRRGVRRRASRAGTRARAAPSRWRTPDERCRSRIVDARRRRRASADDLATRARAGQARVDAAASGSNVRRLEARAARLTRLARGRSLRPRRGARRGRHGDGVSRRGRELRREVAVKVLFPHLARRTTLRRASSARRARPPASSTPTSSGSSTSAPGGRDEPPYIVMELIRGRSLVGEPRRERPAARRDRGVRRRGPGARRSLGPRTTRESSTATSSPRTS